MQERVEHSVRPLQIAPGECAHALEDRVAVALAVGEDGENERSGGGGDEVFVDVHGWKFHA